jgi:hypothetical protein
VLGRIDDGAGTGAKRETLMLLRFVLRVGVAAALVFAAAQPSWAQKPAETPPAAAGKSDVPPPPQSSDPFGEDTTLTAKPIVFLKGTGTWDKAFDTITAALKKLKAYVEKEGLTADGQPMTIFTATDDTGFQFQAAIARSLRRRKTRARRNRNRHLTGGPRAQIRPSRFV